MPQFAGCRRRTSEKCSSSNGCFLQPRSITMSFFDEPYYALTKTHMSRIGAWPEQSKYVKIMWPLSICGTLMSIAGPMVIRLRDVWGDVDSVITSLTQLLLGFLTLIMLLNVIIKIDKIKIMLDDMARHWEIFKNKSAVIVLDKYAEIGYYLATVFSVFSYATLGMYCIAGLLPVILDFVDPLNKTRPKDYIVEAEYGFDANKYYWYITVHAIIATILAINIIIAFETAYVLLVLHACMLFEVVVFNLKLTTSECEAIERNVEAIKNYWNYQKICECIIVHKEAISFAERIENIFSGFFVVIIGVIVILISLTGIQALINMGRPAMLFQALNYTFALTFHLYINNVPGQQMIDHSSKIHTFAYDTNWYTMPVKTQKLWILILIRSNKPCFLTAGKVYILSIESFSSTMQTALSYFMVLAQLL